MSDQDDRDSSPTLPPQRVASPHSEIPIRESDPNLLVNAPAWVAELFRRFDDGLAREEERAKQAHRAANRIADSFLKAEASISLTKTEVEALRSDVRSFRRHLDGSLAEIRNEVHSRMDALEARVTALEKARTP